MDSLRLSDAERAAAVDLIAEHYSLGRLSKEEFDERSDAVWSARTQGDLHPVFVDLPVGPHRGAPAPPSSRPVPPPARSGWHGAGRYVAPVIVVLVVLTVLTHLPFVLIAVGAWFLLGRRHGRGGRWQGPRDAYGRGGMGCGSSRADQGRGW